MAVAVGVSLGALVLATLLTVKATFLALAGAAEGLALWELSRALRSHQIRLPVIPVAIGGTAVIAGEYWSGDRLTLAALAITVIAILAWRLPGGADGYVRDVTAGVFALAYLPLMAVFIAAMLASPDGAYRVLVFVVLTVCSDIGGYFAGISFGRHRMAPVISPNKTWEGLAGSIIACLAAGGILVPYLLGGRPWQGIVAGAAAAVAATLGDLAESMIKRDLKIKDMGSVLPGHGGILDRIDSLLVTAPVLWLVLASLVPVRLCRPLAPGAHGAAGGRVAAPFADRHDPQPPHGSQPEENPERSGIRGAQGYHDYLTFFSPSMLVLSMLFTALQSGMATMTDIDTGMMDKLLTSPVPRAAILAGRVWADFWTMPAQGIVIELAAIAMGVRFATGAGGALVLLAYGTAFGVIWASVPNLIALCTRSAELTMALGFFLTVAVLIPATVASFRSIKELSGISVIAARGLTKRFGAVVGSLISGQIGAIVTVFVWCLAIEQILAGISASAARFLPLLGAMTMAGAGSRAGMPPLPNGIRPLPFAAMTGILAALLVILSAVTAHRLDRDIT